MSASMLTGYHDLWWSESGVSTTVSLGSTGPNGIQYIETPHIDFITGDVLGPQTEVDGVYQGMSAIIQFMIQEAKLATVKKFIRPFTTATANSENNAGYFGLPGTLLSISYMGTLEAIPRTGTPAASNYASGGNGRRFVGLCVSELVESLDTNKRFIPITFRCFPFDDSGTLKIWKRITTANA
jgi:hypothetical protein